MLTNRCVSATRTVVKTIGGENMSLICLEGASAVGKTTTSNEIAKRTNTYIIPEVNLLFERPNEESKTWYLERQVERWMIAIKCMIP